MSTGGPPLRYGFQGVTYDTDHAILPGCTVELHAQSDGSLIASVLSSDVGFYRLGIPNGSASPTFWLRSYLAGNPNRSGTTDLLVGAWF